MRKALGVFRRVDQAVDHARVQRGRAAAGQDRGGGQGLARIHRSPHRGHLLPADQFHGRIDRLGRVALRVPRDQVDRAAAHPAGRIDLVDGKDGAAVEPDAGCRARAGQRRDPADADRDGLRSAGSSRDSRERQGAQGTKRPVIRPGSRACSASYRFPIGTAFLAPGFPVGGARRTLNRIAGGPVNDSPMSRHRRRCCCG